MQAKIQNPPTAAEKARAAAAHPKRGARLGGNPSEFGARHQTKVNPSTGKPGVITNKRGAQANTRAAAQGQRALGAVPAARGAAPKSRPMPNYDRTSPVRLADGTTYQVREYAGQYKDPMWTPDLIKEDRLRQAYAQQRAAEAAKRATGTPGSGHKRK
jgi:hypothetical protein